MMMLRLAASEMAPMIATGMAISSGHGVATTRTARKRTGSPLHAQAADGDGQASGVYRRPAGRPAGGAAAAAAPSRASRCMIWHIANRRPAGRPQRQRRLAIDRAGEHSDPGAFGIMKGSPVRYDSSMTP